KSEVSFRLGLGPLVFSPDHSRMAASNGRADVLVWDIPAGMRLFHLKGHVSVVENLAFSPDGQRLAATAWNRVKFTSGFSGKGAGSGRLPFSPEDYELILWDMVTGSELIRMDVNPPAVAGLSFSPDGYCLAIGGDWEDPPTVSEILDATPRALAPSGQG